ncbi:hypothetical protein F2Q68_00004563 [Brassica cretica]|uniref:Uncharacterized protein n=1 Tax=Brassica cretica TaxID=69181 RepID=A0A8S9JJ94_BRACR|nr:hypothetical protein F2Q68_00004563 [Brassica cretica]
MPLWCRRRPSPGSPVQFDRHFCSSPLQSTLLPWPREERSFGFSSVSWLSIDLMLKPKAVYLERLQILLSFRLRFFERDPVPVCFRWISRLDLRLNRYAG